MFWTKLLLWSFNFIFFLSLFFSPSVNSNCALQIQQGNARCERYTAWNYRKLAVQHLLSNNSDSDSHSIFQDELKLVRSHSHRYYNFQLVSYFSRWRLRWGRISSLTARGIIENGYLARGIRPWTTKCAFWMVFRRQILGIFTPGIADG